MLPQTSRAPAITLIAEICVKQGIDCRDLMSAFSGSIHVPDLLLWHLDLEMYILHQTFSYLQGRTAA